MRQNLHKTTSDCLGSVLDRCALIDSSRFDGISDPQIRLWHVISGEPEKSLSSVLENQFSEGKITPDQYAFNMIAIINMWDHRKNLEALNNGIMDRIELS